MNFTKLPDDLHVPKNEGGCNHLNNFTIPPISLPNQDGNLLRLNRLDTFRVVLYCYPMTGRPDRSLPNNWELIPGARGCTPQTCSFRDNYDKIISLNAIPIGVSTQSVEDIKEMVNRLKVTYDVVSDINLEFSKKLRLPTFEIDYKIYLKRLTLIIKNSVIKKVFYPIFPPDKHVHEVIEWLRKN